MLNKAVGNGGGGDVPFPTFLENGFATSEYFAARKFLLAMPPRYNFPPTVVSQYFSPSHYD